MTGSSIGRQAVVIGAGISGLAAAQALADHFDAVTVLERDSLSQNAICRAGTPQDRHLHGLLCGGQRALSELFPNLEQDLAEAGGVPLRITLDLRHEVPGLAAMPQRDFGSSFYSMSRPLLELTLRRRLAQRENVLLRSDCRALDLVATPDLAGVAAVRFETDSGTRDFLLADLVVDASGRGSLSLALLQSMGWPVPKETAIGVDLGYATAVFAIPDDASTDWKGVVTMARAPESSRAGYLFPIEGGRWIVTLSGRGSDRPPGDAEEFITYAQHLATPTIYDAIKNAERLREIVRFGLAESVWRHFERLDAFPRGLLPIGDAICRFNPVYGQGMSVAAQEARFLHHLLQAHTGEKDPLAGLGQAFLAGVQPLIEAPWMLSAIPDFAFADTRGDRPPDFEDALQYNIALMRIAHRDPAAHKLLIEVLQLVKPPSVYSEPEFERRIRAEMVEMAEAREAHESLAGRKIALGR